MPMNITRFRVRDYAAWRPHFDGLAAKRAEFGLSTPRVYRNTDDTNDVLLLGEADEARVREFLATVDMQTSMERSGVEMATISVKVLPD